MIYRIYSNLSKFKNMEFHPGLNILLADKSPGSTDRQTRNRAGKSSLLEIVHFLSGTYMDPDSPFRKDALINATFGMDWDVGGNRITVERTGNKPNKIFVVSGNTQQWPFPVTVDRAGEKPSITNTQWRNVLGDLIFKLDQDVQIQSWGPKFRSLFSYFVRSENAGGFRSPVRQSVKQQKGDEQVALTFLVGLDWTIPQQFQQTREKERTLRELRKAADKGAFNQFIGTPAHLRTMLAVTEDKVKRLAVQLASFRVLPQYEEYESEASQITRQIAALNDENTMDRELLAHLEEAVSREAAPTIPDVERIFNEAGVVLPNTVLRRFEDVRIFHESIVQNRKSYLDAEIEAAKTRIHRREQEKEKLDNRRAELMSLLRSHGALEHFTNLQAEQTRLQAEFERTRAQYETAAYLESQKTELEAERNRLYQRLRQDSTEQEIAVKNAILSFERVSSKLYEQEQAGRLTLTETQDGPVFDVAIQGATSVGINKMQIFCFDMMLMQLCSDRKIGPKFLVHDSHLFDSVDERQIAKALQEGAKLATEYSFQYIVTMNSDHLPPPRLFSNDFKLDKYILQVRLTDNTVDGGLFGFRFD